MNKRLQIALLALCGGLISARADVIPSFVSAGPSADQQNTVWSYKIDITAEQNVTTGDFFTIYDFGNFMPGSNVEPSGWTFSASLVGTTPSQTNPTDNPSLFNLTWTYSGPTIVGNSPAGQNIGPFSVMTAGFDPEFLQINSNGQFAAQGTLATGPNAGTHVNNVGAISVPAAIPEPSTLALIFGTGGLGVIGRALVRRRR